MPKPYGTWPSLVSARAIAEQAVRLGDVAVDGGDIYWVEGRPAEGGRHVLVRRDANGGVADVVPTDFNVRTRVHEYGGGAFVVSGGEILASNFADQRLYRIRAGLSKTSDGVARASSAVPITPVGDWRYADAVVDRGRRRLIAVREDHTDPSNEPINTLVSIPLDGDPSPGQVIASGDDFYSTPRLSPDGSKLCWLSWRHPQMPWDGVGLWVADVDASGALVQPRLVAGGTTESIYQPGWSPDGVLYFAGDRDGWWRLYRAVVSRDSPSPVEVRPLLARPPVGAEFGRPQWTFGTATWVFAGPRRMVAAFTLEGRWRLAVIDTETRDLVPVATDLEPHEWLAAMEDRVVLVAGSPRVPAAVVSIDPTTGVHDVLRASSTWVPDAADISVPEAMEYPSADGRRAHAFFYPPTSAGTAGPEDERPPLIAIGHGGPTGAASTTLDLRVQFWTTRGFAVVDVNYAGSSGFGRAYRRQLARRWGIVDVEDMVAAVEALVAAGKADRRRLIIRGGSAGGYTALAALVGRPEVFTAGASYYGISDLEALLADTHKFESRYLDGLIGPYPDAREVYRARSPIHAVERLSCPLILFQGLDDRVVPPAQSERMADALRAKGLPVAYLAFDGEQHGFRRASTIVRSLEAELSFYGAVFGFTPADVLEPLAIDNLPPREPASRDPMSCAATPRDPAPGLR